MLVNDIFAERLTLLRSVHRFTYRDLSNVLCINDNTITEWAVSRRNFPNAERLTLLADIFSVSVDWLLGRTDSLYFDEILCGIEEGRVIHWLKTVYDVPEVYENTASRKFNYSLPIRANIITLMYTSQYSAIVQVLGKNFYKDDFFERSIASNSIKIRNALADKLAMQGNIVGKILKKELSEPPFDVEKAFMNLGNNS